MMGYKVGSKNTTVRKRIFERADKLYKKYKDESIEMSEKDARTCVSYYGYFKHSNSKHYMRKTKVNRTIKRAKGVVSNANKSTSIGQDA